MPWVWMLEARTLLPDVPRSETLLRWACLYRRITKPPIDCQRPQCGRARAVSPVRRKAHIALVVTVSARVRDYYYIHECSPGSCVRRAVLMPGCMTMKMPRVFLWLIEPLGLNQGLGGWLEAH